LKSGFDNRSILEVRAADPMAALRALDGMPGVQKTSVFGTAVHAVVAERSADAATRLQRQLEERGVRVVGVTLVPPSLEDVFLDVVSEAA